MTNKDVQNKMTRINLCVMRGKRTGVKFNFFSGYVYGILFHDLLLSSISQHSDWSELTCHNSLH